ARSRRPLRGSGCGCRWGRTRSPAAGRGTSSRSRSHSAWRGTLSGSASRRRATGMSRIPVAGPWITEREVASVAAATADAWYANHNAYQERFERAFAAHVGRAHAISLPSCTAGLHLALLGLGVGPGDEVVVPELTWIASAAPVSYVGATPVFADVDERTWCLTPATLEARLPPRTRA